MVVGDFPLKNKVVIVTGGGSGINLAFVRLALKDSCKVLIADLKLIPESEELVSASNGQAAFTKCDVSQWKDLEALPGKVQESFGKDVVADVWIAGAGVFEPAWGSFLHDTETEHYKQLQINTEHPIKLTRIAMKTCIAANKPAVVLIVASMAGIDGSYGAPIYVASKHAVVGFTKSMAQADIDENIKVVSVCPGLVNTPLWTGEQGKEARDQFSFSPEMCVTAEDVADAMVELIQESKYAGGALLQVSKSKPRNVLESKQAMSGTPEMMAWLERTYAPARDLWNKLRGGQQNSNL